MNVDRLKGKKAVGAKGYALGEVKGAEADTENWQITHLIVKLSDKAAYELGFKKRFRGSTVCMPVSLVQDIGEVVTMGKSLFELSGDLSIKECEE